MAQNLNYQTGLTHQTSSASPTTTVGRDLNLIGNFWCPGGYSSNTPTSTLASCAVWGALYSWETAMSFNGLGGWSSDLNTYCTGSPATENCKQNWGRTATGSGSGGRGICPENWHVPTDYDWAVILDGMESGGGTQHQYASGYGWRGADAGARAKSKCTCEFDESGSECVSDEQVNWYYDDEKGIDYYGMRLIPSGGRGISYMYDRGFTARFWTSTAGGSDRAKIIRFNHNNGQVYRVDSYTCPGYSVRCVHD
jgi:uncharacterized protein (TIGR02145 family)